MGHERAEQTISQMLKLMIAAMIGASDRWNGFRVTGFERSQMDQIRKDLDEEYEQANGPVHHSSKETHASRLSNRIGTWPIRRIAEAPVHRMAGVAVKLMTLAAIDCGSSRIRVFTALRVNAAASNRRIDRPMSAVKLRIRFLAVFAQLIQYPPSTLRVWATTYSASSEARNTAAPVWSSGTPMRPKGTSLPTSRFFSPAGRRS